MNKSPKKSEQSIITKAKILKIIVKTVFFLILPTFLTLFFAVKFIKILLPKEAQKCTNITPELEKNSLTITKNRDLKQSVCYEFSAQSGDKLIIDTNSKINLTKPNLQNSTLQGNNQETLLQEGKYSIHIPNPDYDYIISLKIVSEDSSWQQESSQDSSLDAMPQIDRDIPLQQISYHPVKVPPFNENINENETLQKIVDKIVQTALSRGLPTDSLSISLVDLSEENCCTYASFQDQYPRYPASIVKLFWLVALFGQYNAEIRNPKTIPPEKLEKMIIDSDNEASSLILDEITQTKSSKQKLTSEEIEQWITKRYWVNNFFKQADYRNLNISQKTFPIPYLQLNGPEGPDLQIREIHGEPDTPVRNYLNTYSVARLLYEIDREVAISTNYSQKIKQLIKRKLQPQFWQDKPYNSIKFFLGEGLPQDTHFYSKMGWTFSNRNDAAIIASLDGKVHYILVIFGDNPKFYEDKTFLPTISAIVYEEMVNRSVIENP